MPGVPAVDAVAVPDRALRGVTLGDRLRPAREQPRAVDDEGRGPGVGRVALQARELAVRGREQVAEQVTHVAEGRGGQAGLVGGAAEVAVLGGFRHVADGEVPRVLDARGDDDLGGVAAAARGAAGEGWGGEVGRERGWGSGGGVVVEVD